MRPTVVKFGIFTLVSLLFMALLFNTMANNVDGGTVDYHAQFTDVSGLRVGDDVRVAGVKVGRVQSIAVDGREAAVELALSKDQPLLSTTRIVMRYQNLLGQRYLSLVQDSRRGTRLQEGATVPVNRTSPGFDLTALLNGFRPLFAVLEPADVNRLSESVVKVLQGEGGSVAELLRQTGQLTNYLADREGLFDQVVTNLTPVLDNLAGQGTELRSTVVELRRLMTGLARNRVVIGDSLDSISNLARTTTDLLRDARAPLARDVRALREVTAMYAEQGELFGRSLDAFGGVLSALGRGMSYRSAINTYFCTLDVTILGVRVGTTTTGDQHSAVCR